MTLSYNESEIREATRSRHILAPLPRIFARQAWAELRVRLFKKVNFRKSQNAEALQAYEKMTLEEFDGINARQRWSNWRTIPRNLSGTVANAPILALDLCCGIGQSTEVLAYYLHPESKILGLEHAAHFVELARSRKYLNRDGSAAHATFRSQSVLETFRDENGKPFADASVDLVNCCGAIGAHFKPEVTSILVKEVTRVLKPGGHAMLDCGHAGTSKKKLLQIAEANGLKKIKVSQNSFLDFYPQVCFLKPV